MKRTAAQVAGVILGALALAAVLAAPAGASGNGIANGTPRQILTKAISALGSAQSFRVTGIVHDKGQTTTLAVTASKNGNGFGTVTLDGSTVQIVKVGGNLYFRAGADFWRSQSGAQAASLLANRWVKGPATDPDFSQLASFFTTGALTNEFLGKAGTSTTRLAKVGTSSINGQPVLVLSGRDISDGDAGRIFVATTGQPYVVRVTLLSGSGGAGNITFTRFNAAVNPTAPAGALALGGSTGGSSTTATP